MNEKIKQLAEQAGGQFGDGLEFAVVFGELDDFKKFAEMIVRECLDQCYYRGMNDELYEGQLKAASYIEQHFGVEE